MADVTIDGLLGGRVRIVQPRRGHRAGTDAVLLAGLAEVRPGDLAVDLGSASGAVGLMLAVREPGARIVLVEREAELVDMAREAIGLNGLEERVGARQADVFAPWPADLAGSADLVVTNPPFTDAGGRTSPVPGRRSARTMEGGDLGDWLRSAGRLLKPGGRLAIIHRADSLERCLLGLGTVFGSRTILPIHPTAEAAANRIVVTAVKGGKAPILLRPALVLHDGAGRFTEAAERLHGPPGA